MVQENTQLLAFLQAIADCEPCDRVPKVEHLDGETQRELVSRAAHLDWIDARVFMGDGTLPQGEVLRLTEEGRIALREGIQRQDAGIPETDDISISERRERRARVMESIYELAGGARKVVDRSDIAKTLDWEEPRVRPVVRYLVDRELLSYETLAGGVSLTARGIDEVEEAMSPQSEGTENLAGLRVITGDVAGGVQVVQGDHARVHHVASASDRRGFWKWVSSSIWTVVLGAAAILVAGVVAAVLATSGHKHPPSSAASNGGGAPGQVTPSNGHPVAESADNLKGSPVFASPRGEAVRGVPTRMPFGTRVLVACQAPNRDRALASVSAFYLIASGRWKGDYVVSDTMTNGGPLGNTNTPNVDRSVPRCH
jgi:hypothetical protein